MESSGFRKLRNYQISWSLGAIFTITVALSLPVANFLIVKHEAVLSDAKNSIEVGLLRCFSILCEKATFEKDKQVFYLPLEQYGLDQSERDASIFEIENYKLQRKINRGFVGTMICFVLAGLVVLMQFVSMLTGGLVVETFMQSIRLGCVSPRTPWLMIIGSVCLLSGFFWYVLITGPILNGGKYVSGFWISLISAICTLIISVWAYRDRSVWDFFYQPIPDPPDFREEKYKAIEIQNKYQGMEQSIVMYAADSVFFEGNVAA